MQTTKLNSKVTALKIIPRSLCTVHNGGTNKQNYLEPKYLIYFDIRLKLNLCKYIVDETIFSQVKLSSLSLRKKRLVQQPIT